MEMLDLREGGRKRGGVNSNNEDKIRSKAQRK